MLESRESNNHDQATQGIVTTYEPWVHLKRIIFRYSFRKGEKMIPRA
jgi:hypothetical protein